MRRKFNRTRDRFGRTFKGKDYIASHEFLPPIKLPAYLYPIFIQKNPRFRGRKPDENPIQFPARRGETASLFKRRVDRVIKSYDKAFHRQKYILARRGGYDKSMETYKQDLLEKEKKRAKEQEKQQLDRKCEFIQKQIQSAPKNSSRRVALEKDFKQLCQKKLGLAATEKLRKKVLWKRGGKAIIAGAKGFKKMKPEDIKKLREKFANIQAACKRQGKIYKGRKDESGRYICEPNPQGRLGDVSSVPVKQKYVERAARARARAAEMAQWNRLPLETKAERCEKGRTKVKALKDKVRNRYENDTLQKLIDNYGKKKCEEILKQARAKSINIDGDF